MNAFLKTLLLLSASGSVLGLLLTLARRLSGRRLPSTLWYYAWLPVLLRLVLPVPGLIPQTWASEDAADVVSVQTENTEKRSYRYDSAVDVSVPGEIPGQTETAAEEPAAAAEGVSEAVPETVTELPIRPDALIQTPGFWFCVWAAGAVLCFMRYAAGYLRFSRVLRRTCRPADGQTLRVCKDLTGFRAPALLSSSYVKTPMLLGVFRPWIVLPQGTFSEESVRNVLRHELTHYRRGDLYRKWFFVLVSSLHWFNPLMLLFRRELDRVCELSCDEYVLSRMKPSERHSYGETLLDLAVNRTLPAGVVATTFSTEKRALKERLEQIMTFKFTPRAILALTMAALLLMGTAAFAAGPVKAEAGPADRPEPAADATAAVAGFSDLDTIAVSTVDELLAAIRPGVCAVLAPGTYDLSTASDYGQDSENEWYRWEAVGDGYELAIGNVTHMAITASSDDPTATVLCAVSRYADVLAFTDCLDITLSGFTAGHTADQGMCAGGVIHLMGCEKVSVDRCGLYGCGVLGVDAENCRNILVHRSDIYECSDGAVELTDCRNVQFDRCDFRDCYNRSGETSPAFWIFSVDSCYGVAVTDGHVFGNVAMESLHVESSQEVYVLGTLFEENTVSVLSVTGDPIVIDGCEFRDEFALSLSGTSAAVDLEGNELSYQDLASMKQTSVRFPGFAEMEVPALDRLEREDGQYEVHVSTVDELLAAIAPNTAIYLAEGLYNLSEASSYGCYGGQYYYWVGVPDGEGLVISGVENLSIVGPDKDSARIETLPRYADVIRFDDCRNVSLQSITAGHTTGAGSCDGVVLRFRDCVGAAVRDCGLFGCGTFGVKTEACSDILAEDNEIYQCSLGAVSLLHTLRAEFTDNDIHDCAYPTYSMFACSDITIDGEAVEETAIKPDETAFYEEEAQGLFGLVLPEIIADGTIIKAETIDVSGAGPYKSAVQIP